MTNTMFGKTLQQFPYDLCGMIPAKCYVMDRDSPGDLHFFGSN